MRHLTPFIVAVVILAGFGSRALASAPTTQPRAGKVAVLPFEQTKPGAPDAWIGGTIRQGVLSDLIPYAPGRIAPLNQRADDDKAAIDAARKAGAAYAVTGNVVAAGNQVRFDGRVLDVETGDAVAPLKATGPADNLCAVQTALAGQLGRTIGLTMPASPAPSPENAANPWPTNDNPAQYPYASGADDVPMATDGSDFVPSGYGPYPYGPYLGPLFVVPRSSHHHDRGGFDSLNDTEFGTLGVPSIAGGGGTPALDGGVPYGTFIPTNRAESRAFNRYGGLGTVNIARAPRPAGTARHAAGAHHR